MCQGFCPTSASSSSSSSSSNVLSQRPIVIVEEFWGPHCSRSFEYVTEVKRLDNFSKQPANLASISSVAKIEDLILGDTVNSGTSTPSTVAPSSPVPTIDDEEISPQSSIFEEVVISEDLASTILPPIAEDSTPLLDLSCIKLTLGELQVGMALKIVQLLEGSQSAHLSEEELETTAVKKTMYLALYGGTLAKGMGCSLACYPLALSYIERVVASGKRLEGFCKKRLLLVALVLAAKYVDDFYLKNTCYARLGGLTLQELNKLELQFITALDFKLHLGSRDFLNLVADITTGFERVLQFAKGRTAFQQKQLVKSVSSNTIAVVA